MTKAEMTFITDIFHLHKRRLTKDDLRRPIHITPFEGAYGRAGLVLTVQGSPPQGIVLVLTASAGSDEPAYIVDCTVPYKPRRLDPTNRRHNPLWTSARNLALHEGAR